MKKKLLILFLLCSTLLLAASGIVVSATETEDDYNYNKIGFWTFRTSAQREFPSNADELEEMFTYITGYQEDPSNGMYVSVRTVTGENRRVVFPYGELTSEYLLQLVADKTIRSISVGHDSLPVDDSMEGGAEQTGDSAVYAVITLCVAAAALTSLVVLRKKRI